MQFCFWETEGNIDNIKTIISSWAQEMKNDREISL